MSKFDELYNKSEDELAEAVKENVKEEIRLAYDTAIMQQNQAKVALKKAIRNAEVSLANGGVADLKELELKELELEETDVLIDRLTKKKVAFLG